MRANRPDMYNLKEEETSPFVPRKLRFEVSERVSFEGDIVEPLNLNELDEILIQCQDSKVKAIAIQFMHSYLYLNMNNFVENISQKSYLRSDNLPTIFREMEDYERASTAVLNGVTDSE